MSLNTVEKKKGKEIATKNIHIENAYWKNHWLAGSINQDQSVFFFKELKSSKGKTQIGGLHQLWKIEGTLIW